VVSEKLINNTGQGNKSAAAANLIGFFLGIIRSFHSSYYAIMNLLAEISCNVSSAYLFWYFLMYNID